MKTTASHLPVKLPTDFVELNRMFPLRPINDKVDLANAYEVMDRLAVLAKRTRDQNDYLETLITLTEKFDPPGTIVEESKKRVSGLDLLKYLADANDLAQADVAGILGVSRSAVAMIMSGERSITANHARALGKRFKLDAGAFL